MRKLKKAKQKLELPDKLSALIRVAVADLRKVRKDPRYAIDPFTWHSPTTNNDGTRAVCHVCMAGAVMAKTLHVNIRGCITPKDLPDSDTSSKLSALDSVRSGGITTALHELGVYWPPKDGAMILAAHHKILNGRSSIHGFAKPGVYLEVADMLEKIGL